MSWAYVGEPWFRPGLLGLHVLLAVLLASLVVSWWRDAPALRGWVGGCVSLAVLWLLLVPRTVFEPLVDPAWFQVLQEGDVASLWNEIIGGRGHIGPGWSRFLADLLPLGPALPRRWIAFQLWFLPPLLLLHLLAARALSRSAFAAVVLTGAVGLAPSFRIAVVSDQFVVAPSLLVVAGLLPLAVAGDPAQPLARRLRALLTLVVFVPVMLTYREESSGLPLTALVGAIVGLLVPPSARERLRAWVSARLGTSEVVLLALAFAVWVAACWRFGEATAPWRLETAQQWSWLIVAVWPLNPTWTMLPLFLASELTLGLALLALIGLVRSIVVLPLRSCLIGLGVVVLVQAYYASAHGMVASLEGLSFVWWELYRYLFNLQVVFSLFGALAWPVVTRWRGRSSVALAVLWALACLLPPLTGVPQWLHAQPHDATTVGPSTANVDQDPQRFYRWFAPRFAADPGCVWITQTRRWGGLTMDDTERLAWAVLVPDEKKGHELKLRPIAETPRAAVDAVAPGATCAWLVAAPDCNLAQGGPCLSATEGLPAVEREVWAHRPYMHPQHGYFYTDELVIGRWRLIP